MSFVSTRAAAEQLGVSDETVRRWAHSGILKAERRGPRLMFVDADSFTAESVNA